MDSLPLIPVSYAEWLQQRQQLVRQLAEGLHRGFEAVAAYQGTEYLECVERQEALARQLAELDAGMPGLPSDSAAREQAGAEVRAMNRELRRLADIQTALIEIGGRSVRCFQRVWALGAPGYGHPQGGR